MRGRRLLSLALALTLCVCFCVPIFAEGELLFVAVDDTIPLTLSELPYETSTGIYVPYTVFDASPGGVIPAYNASAQTFVLFTRQRRLVFDLAEGKVSDQDGNVKTVSTTFRNGTLYVPLVYCASFFGLKTSVLKSESGYPVLRFTTGGEVYDDSLFVEKAESLISYRVEQMKAGNTETSAPPAQSDPVKNPQQEPEAEPEQPPAQIYLAFTNAGTMAQNAALLAQYDLRGAFFLTGAEIEADPALCRALYAAGHMIGLTVEEDCADVEAALQSANEALCRALNRKSLFALLREDQKDGVEDFCVLTRPPEQVSAEFAAQQTNAPQLLVISEDFADELAVLRAANAELLLLRETTPEF